MATLKNEHKRLIVQRLATFVSATDIQRELQDAGVAVSFSQIAYYDPQSAGTDLAESWRTLHAETRNRFIEDTSSIAITHQAYRLRELLDMQREARKKKNYPLAASLLKQAAEDFGGAYTNKREVTGRDGRPLMPGSALDDLSDEELRQLAAKLAQDGQ